MYCLRCDKQFTPRRPNQLYCDQVCRKKMRKPPARHGNMQPAIRICKRCGDLFVTTFSGRKYCDRCKGNG